MHVGERRAVERVARDLCRREVLPKELVLAKATKAKHHEVAIGLPLPHTFDQWLGVRLDRNCSDPLAVFGSSFTLGLGSQSHARETCTRLASRSTFPPHKRAELAGLKACADRDGVDRTTRSGPPRT